jgi:predicted ribosome quality control (RQC) complex YloA/Tae2 family protein
MKTEMSSFDIMAMVSELQMDMRVKKIYQPTPSQLRILVRFREGGTKNLMVELGKRMYLSEFAIPSPKFPSNFVMTLRKYISNSIVKEIQQVGFDRIVELVLVTSEGDYKLIIEIFGEGNIVLTDSDGTIKAVMKPKKFKHRDLVGKATYSYPPQRLNPFQISPEKLKEVVGEYGSVVKALAMPLGLGGLYGEEVCLRGHIKKDSSSITAEEADEIVKVLTGLKNKALRPKPVIVYENDTPVDVLPSRLKTYSSKRAKEFQSFNEALDNFFTTEVIDQLDEEAEKKFKNGLISIGLRLREQARAIGRFGREARDGKLIGDTIYANFEEVQDYIDSLAMARKTMSVKEITSKLEDFDHVKQYLPKENAIVVEMGGFEFKLDLSMRASKNADYYYSKSKKAKEKLIGARGAAEKTKLQIKNYISKGEEKARREEGVPVKKVVRKVRWFERFRWFKSSDDLLVIGGRDASSNETAVKRHMEKGDIFVHAEIHGAPAVVIKFEGDVIPDRTIDEACQFAASNSTAWKSNAAFLDTYWVTPDQVSKTPKSGEYVGKGAFIIRGKRNYRRSKISLSIGVAVGEEAEVMCGPFEAVKKHCNYLVTVIPGRMKSKEVSHKIKEIILGEAIEEHKDAIKQLNVDEIQRVLPTGGYSIKVKSR